MKTVKIKYKRNVTSPPNQVGKAGETKDVEPRIARNLVKGGYAEEVRSEKAEVKKK